MDVLKRIEELRNAKGWSIYKLCNEADLTPSTITNMFTRGTYPSISTLTNICSAFGITLAEFFDENIDKTLTEDEFLLIKDYKKLNSKQKHAIKELINSMIKKD